MTYNTKQFGCFSLIFLQVHSFVTLPVGSYRLTAFIHSSYNYPDSYWSFLAGDKEIANLHCTVVNIQELQSEIFTLNEKTTLYIPQCGDDRSGIDLLYITKEKYVEPVTITADNKTMNYGDDVPSLTYKSSGATLEGIPKLSTTATSSSPVGTYPIKVEQGTVSNGNVIYVNGTLTIEPAAGIESVYADGLGNAVIYNVNGQKLLKPQKGINIIGGKKVVLK